MVESQDDMLCEMCVLSWCLVVPMHQIVHSRVCSFSYHTKLSPAI